MATKNSNTLYIELTNTLNDAMASIIDIMQKNGITEIDLLTDKNGLSEDDEDCDIDFIYDNRAWANCFSKYCNEEAFISSIKIKNGNIILEAIGEGSEYDNDHIYHTASLYIYLLKNLEMRFGKDAPEDGEGERYIKREDIIDYIESNFEQNEIEKKAKAYLRKTLSEEEYFNICDPNEITNYVASEYIHEHYNDKALLDYAKDCFGITDNYLPKYKRPMFDEENEYRVIDTINGTCYCKQTFDIEYGDITDVYDEEGDYLGSFFGCVDEWIDDELSSIIGNEEFMEWKNEA